MLDGTTETEREAIKWLSLLGAEIAAPASEVVTMAWVQDDITGTERDALKELSWLAHDSEESIAAIVAMPWVQDDITKSEAEAIRHLRGIVRKNPEVGNAILAMPFLDTHEPEDTATLMALYRAGRRGKLESLLAQPVFRDGIEDADGLLAIAGPSCL